MPALQDIATVLYQPKETMRRVLDSGSRWSWQIVTAAALCTAVGDMDFKGLTRALPSLSQPALIGLAIGSTIGVAIGWNIMLWIFGWIATAVARLLGGTAPARDVRAALAWSLVPLIWAIVYRIPEVMYKHQLIAKSPTLSERQLFVNLLANGGCSGLLVILAVQLLLCIWCAWIASATLAEAERFSVAQGFGTLVLSVIAPIGLIVAAVIALRV